MRSQLLPDQGQGQRGRPPGRSAAQLVSGYDSNRSPDELPAEEAPLTPQRPAFPAGDELVESWPGAAAPIPSQIETPPQLLLQQHEGADFDFSGLFDGGRQAAERRLEHACRDSTAGTISVARRLTFDDARGRSYTECSRAAGLYGSTWVRGGDHFQTFSTAFVRQPGELQEADRVPGVEGRSIIDPNCATAQPEPDDNLCPVCLEHLPAHEGVSWPGCSRPHRFHYSCLAAHGPISAGLAHLTNHGDSGILCQATCPLCRKPWGDNADALAQLTAFVDALRAQGYNVPARGCECPRCDEIGAGPEVPRALAEFEYFTRPRPPGADDAPARVAVVCPAHPHCLMRATSSRVPRWSAPGVLMLDAAGRPVHDVRHEWVCGISENVGTSTCPVAFAPSRRVSIPSGDTFACPCGSGADAEWFFRCTAGGNPVDPECWQARWGCQQCMLAPADVQGYIAHRTERLAETVVATMFAFAQQLPVDLEQRQATIYNHRWSHVVVPWLWNLSENDATGMVPDRLAQMCVQFGVRVNDMDGAAIVWAAWQEMASGMRARGVMTAGGLMRHLADEWGSLRAWVSHDSRFSAMEIPEGMTNIPRDTYIPDYIQEFVFERLAHPGSPALSLLAPVLGQLANSIREAQLPPQPAPPAEPAVQERPHPEAVPADGHLLLGTRPAEEVAAAMAAWQFHASHSGIETARVGPLLSDGVGGAASADIGALARTDPEPHGQHRPTQLHQQADDEAANMDLVDDAIEAAVRARPHMPVPMPTRSAELGWPAIDHVPIHACAVSCFRHLDDVPTQHREAWAIAWVDILELLDGPVEPTTQIRAIKWMLVLHDMLLRLPPRGGRRGHSIVANRFAAWASGDLAALVRWWEADREAARRRRQSNGQSDNAAASKTLERALFLISEGEMSKGVALLTSKGLGDLDDERVRAQLRAKHPSRKELLHGNLASLGDFPRVRVELRATIEGLSEHAGTGPSGFRNEYLKCLAADFADLRARTVLSKFEDFAEAYVNAELPDWFYAVFTAVKAMAPIKKEATSVGEAPDVRPIGIGECLRRCIHSALVSQYKPLLRDHLWPQQVALGVEGGLSILVFGLRLALEVHPDWVVVKMDMRNAFNEIKRRCVVDRLNQTDHLRGLVPATWATCSPESKVYFAGRHGLEEADYDSADGVQQGDALASAGFCVAIHPEVKALDAELALHGGAAKFDMDDGYAAGPPGVVFPAVERFAAAVRESGLELQIDKSNCFSPMGGLQQHPLRPPSMPVGQVILEDGTVGFGIEEAGVPVGDGTFIKAFLDDRTQKTMSKIHTVTNKLRDLHRQTLYAATQYCLNPMFHYLLQHCYPSDSHTQAERIDAAVEGSLAICLGQAAVRDDIARQRLRLPARMYGGSIRSAADVAPAAFLGTVAKVMPRMLDRRDEDFNVQPGFLQMLSGILGAASFDVLASSTRFETLTSSGTRLGNTVASLWQALQAEVGEVTDGPLATPVAGMGSGCGGKLQRALTRQREKLRFDTLDANIRALPPDDMRRLTWLNLDKNSTVWVAAWPGGESYLSNPEFDEVTAMYFGLPSPACAPLAGQRIGNTRITLDRYGSRLAAAQLPGDGWRLQHDAIKWRITQDAKEMGVAVRTEVYGLFAACIPQEGRARAAQEPTRKRQGLVPDFSFTIPFDGPERELLFELKTLHVGSSTYPASAQRCEPVARRARALPGEYAAKARQVDRKFCRTAEGDIGPVEAKIRSFEPVRGLVFGAWAEASPDVDRLIGVLAGRGSERHWRGMLAASAEEAKGALAWLLRRRWAMTALRENARLKIDRLQHVGAGAAAAQLRRASAATAAAARARRGALAARRGTRVRGVSRL